MARPRLTAEERSERRQRERLRSKARRQTQRSKQAAQTIREVRRTASIRLLEHRTSELHLRTEQVHRTVTNVTEDCSGLNDVLGIHDDNRSYEQPESDTDGGQGASQNFSIESRVRYVLPPIRPSHPELVANLKEVPVRGNCLIHSNATGSDQQKECPAEQGAQENGGIEGEPPSISSRRVRFHRIRKRDARRRQHILEANMSQGQIRIITRPADVAIPQNTTSDNHDRYHRVEVMAEVENLRVSANYAIHEGASNGSPRFTIENGPDCGAMPEAISCISNNKYLGEEPNSSLVEAEGSDFGVFEPPEGPEDGLSFQPTSATPRAVFSTAWPVPSVSLEGTTSSPGTGSKSASPDVLLNRCPASPQFAAPITSPTSASPRAESTTSTSRPTSSRLVLRQYIQAFAGKAPYCPDILTALYDKALKVFFDLPCDCESACMNCISLQINVNKHPRL